MVKENPHGVAFCGFFSRFHDILACLFSNHRVSWGLVTSALFRHDRPFTGERSAIQVGKARSRGHRRPNAASS